MDWLVRVGLVFHLLLFVSCQHIGDSSELNEVADQHEPQDCFRAAVYEHYRIDSTDCKESLKMNLAVYETAAMTARKNGANIIVFPEYGIFVGSLPNVLECLEEVPDPAKPETKFDSGKNYCSLKGQTKNEFSVLTELSCIAERNNIYVVANFGSKERCEPNTEIGELRCPAEGFLTFNTNVVFDAQGNFVSRYRKYHLFGDAYNKAPKPELIHFKTPFGTFGQFICFDILFKDPAIDLIEENKIDTILFPSNWFDNVPLLTAIQVQDFWSLRNNVNLLAANNLQPFVGTTGSGIYSIDNSSIYVSASSTSPQLILQTLPSNSNNIEKCRAIAEPKKLSLKNVRQLPEMFYRSTDVVRVTDDDIILDLGKPEDDIQLCHKKVCCQLVYKIAGKDVPRGLVLIIRDNPRPITGWYEQFCALAIKDSSSKRKIFYDYDTGLSLKYEKLSISGKFSTKYVFPTASESVHELIDRSSRKFTCKQEEGATSCDQSLLEPKFVNSFGLYARYFDAEMK